MLGRDDTLNFACNDYKIYTDDFDSDSFFVLNSAFFPQV